MPSGGLCVCFLLFNKRVYRIWLIDLRIYIYPNEFSSNIALSYDASYLKNLMSHCSLVVAFGCGRMQTCLVGHICVGKDCGILGHSWNPNWI